ncbi:hypothetical protein E4U58_001990, partial [Claviceps cyperi]
MASTGKSRWADSEEDAVLEAKLKQEKEEKRLRKAEKARKTESDRPVAAASSTSNTNGHDDDARPPKRRRLAHEPPPQEAKLLRFEPGPSWMPCRSVENYDKLNDIDEGAYGWVARGVQRATGKVVALKRLKLTPADRNGLPVTGLREIQILQDCSHRNVVGLEEVVIGDDVARLD